MSAQDSSSRSRRSLWRQRNGGRACQERQRQVNVSARAPVTVNGSFVSPLVERFGSVRVIGDFASYGRLYDRDGYDAVVGISRSPRTSFNRGLRPQHRSRSVA
jgi:hypothetical protein